MADRQGIEIDYCPSCRGVWLDRGELDKIIERSAAYTQSPVNDDFNTQQPKQVPPPQQTPPPQQPYGGHYNQQQPYYGNQRPYNDPYYKHKKKKGFLSDFFDFD